MFEGLPNVLLEAQCLKKFIISTNCPTGPKEILMNGTLGDLVSVGNYKKISLKLLENYKNHTFGIAAGRHKSFQIQHKHYQNLLHLSASLIHNQAERTLLRTLTKS